MRATSAYYIPYKTNFGMDDSDIFTIDSQDKSPSTIIQSGCILDNEVQFVIVYNALGIIIFINDRLVVCV